MDKPEADLEKKAQTSKEIFDQCETDVQHVVVHLLKRAKVYDTITKDDALEIIRETVK